MGLYTSERLCAAGYDVVLGCRDPARGAAAEARVSAAGASAGGSATCEPLDLADLRSVRAFASKVSPRGPVALLVNNAGVMATPPWTTSDGLEFQMGINHVGHFELTRLLLPQLEASGREGGARVVVVASAAHRACEELDTGALGQVPEGYKPWAAYGASKAANILFARELARRLKEGGSAVTVNALCPGFVDTELGRHIVGSAPLWQRPLMALVVPWAKSRAKTVEDGASTALHLATSEAALGVSGEYFVDSERAESTPLAQDMELAKELWDATEALIDRVCPA